MGVRTCHITPKSEIGRPSSSCFVTPTLFLKRGHEAVHHPLERFPIEIWDKVLSCSLSVEDLTNVYNATPDMPSAFSTGLKCTIMLPEVIKILSRSTVKRVRKKTDEGKTTIVPTEHKYISNSDLFKLCKISRQWNQTIRNFTLHHEFQFIREATLRPEYTLIGDIPESFGCSSLHSPHLQKSYNFSILTGRMKHPRGIKSKSFITRRISIKEPLPSRINAPEVGYWDKVLTLLTQSGGDIWHCKIVLNQSTPKSQQYIQVIRVLEKVPNLKTLEICRLPVAQSSCVNQSISPEDLACPTLKNLVLLTADNIPHDLLNKIIRKNRHVPKINIQRPMCCRQYHLDLHCLTSLTEISISIHNASDLSILEKAAQEWVWPIRDLSLNFEPDCQFVAWREVFEVIHLFSSTLQILKLKLPQARCREEQLSIAEASLVGNLNLPLLKTLRLVLPNPAAIDFLHPMRNSLENLKVIVDHCDKYAEIIQGYEVTTFNGNFENMLESNLWEKFPKLEGNLDIAVRKNPRTTNYYLREDFDVYTYMGRKLVAINGY